MVGAVHACDLLIDEALEQDSFEDVTEPLPLIDIEDQRDRGALEVAAEEDEVLQELLLAAEHTGDRFQRLLHIVYVGLKGQGQ